MGNAFHRRLWPAGEPPSEEGAIDRTGIPVTPGRFQGDCDDMQPPIETFRRRKRCRCRLPGLALPQPYRHWRETCSSVSLGRVHGPGCPGQATCLDGDAAFWCTKRALVAGGWQDVANRVPWPVDQPGLRHGTKGYFATERGVPDRANSQPFVVQISRYPLRRRSQASCQGRLSGSRSPWPRQRAPCRQAAC